MTAPRIALSNCPTVLQVFSVHQPSGLPFKGAFWPIGKSFFFMIGNSFSFTIGLGRVTSRLLLPPFPAIRVVTCFGFCYVFVACALVKPTLHE